MSAKAECGRGRMRLGQNAARQNAAKAECGRGRRPRGLGAWRPGGLGAWRLGGLEAWRLASRFGGLEAWTQTLEKLPLKSSPSKASHCADIQNPLNDFITLLLNARAGSFRLNAILLLLTQCVWHARGALVRPTCNAEPVSQPKALLLKKKEKDDASLYSGEAERENV